MTAPRYVTALPRYDPLILSGQATSIPNGGALGLDDVSRLVNPARGAILIDEARFDLPSPPAPPAAGSMLGMAIGAKLMLGRLPLTRQYVPIAMLSRRWDEWRESASVGNPALPISASTSPIANTYIWRFKRPLYVPPGEGVIPQFNYQTFGTNGYPNSSQSVRITYACRVLPEGYPAPRSISVPWATVWQSAALTSSTTALQKSTEGDLYNPFPETLAVHEFIGRIQSTTGGNVGSDALIDSYEGTNIRMVDSAGNICIRDNVPFGNAFSMVDRSWRMHATLAKGGFFLVEVEPGINSGDASAQVCVSMLGYRDVLLNPVSYRGLNQRPGGPP